MADPKPVKKFTVIEYVERFITLNCSGQLYVYVEDEFAALEDVLLSLVDESMLAYTRARLRPKRQRNTQHFGKRRWTQPTPEDEEILPDLARETGKNMKIIDGPFEPTYKAGGKMLWIISDTAAEFAYLLLLLNIVQNYTYESLHLLSTDPRNNCAQGWGNGLIKNDVNRASPAGSWSPLVAFLEQRVGPPNFVVHNRIFAGPGLHDVFWGLHIKNISTFLNVTYYLAIGDQTTETWLYKGSETTLGPGEEIDDVIEARNYPEGEILMWIHAVGNDFFEVTNCNMMCCYQGPVPPKPKPPRPERPLTQRNNRGPSAPYKRKRPRKQYKLKFVKYRS